jgi:hypothetical protein
MSNQGQVAYEFTIDSISLKNIGIVWLDYRHYFTRLVKSMSLYIVQDEFPNDMLRIDNGELTAVEGKELIDRLQTEIVRRYINLYYPSGKEAFHELSEMRERSRRVELPASALIHVKFPTIGTTISSNEKEQMLQQLKASNIHLEECRQRGDRIYRHFIISPQKPFAPRDTYDSQCIEMAQRNAADLLSMLFELEQEIASNEKCITELYGISVHA